MCLYMNKSFMYLNDIDYCYFEGYITDSVAVKIVYFPINFVLICQMHVFISSKNSIS